MITFNNTKTIKDIVVNSGTEFENRVFIRFERDDVIYEKGYGTFMKDTLAIASYIEDQGKKLSHNPHVAILGKCSYEYLTVLLGAPIGGGVSIPLDIQLSEDRLIANLEKADTDILFFDYTFLSQANLLMEKCPFIKRFICLQRMTNQRCVPMIHRVYRSEKLTVNVKPADLAMIIFTSGTTGNGKGVMLSHGNVIDNMFCTDDETEVCLNVLPIHHVFCISGDVFLVLRYGSTLCLCDDVSKMLYYIKLFNPTVMRVVPMMAKMLVNRVAILQKSNPEKSLDEIKAEILGKRMYRLTSGGGYLSKELSDALAKIGIITGQGYGMSECSPKISAPVYERKDKVASVGHLVTGCKVRIVDGEIQVSSPSVMMGYYNDPELTKEAITEDGYLRTGDLGYIDDEDFLYLSGRKKNLIILSNGENVSPEMIENLFDSDRLVTDIIAYGKGEIIAAEIYPNFEYAQVNGITDIKAALDEIVSAHNEELPTYAQIRECILRTVPFKKTSSNKIVRNVYFDEVSEINEKKQNLKLPENDVQKQLYELAIRAIGNDNFGIDDKLYECGLDSMGSTMLIADIADEMEENITLAELMDNPSIIMLEKLFQTKKAEVKIDLSKKEVYPLTSMQKYFAYIIPGNTTGNLPFCFKMEKSIDLYRLRDAIYKVLDAHPALKAIVKPTEQKYYAIFRDDSRQLEISIEKINDAQAEQKMQELIVPFRYREDDDLVHIHLFEGEEYKYLFFDVAHFMGDGVSMNIIMEDLQKAYEGEEFAYETYTTYEYILEESQRESNGIRAKDVDYVNQMTKGLKLRRSILNKAKAEDLSEGKYAVIKKPFERLPRQSLLHFGKKYGVSENAIFIAAFNYCIALFQGEEDVFSNSIHSGRTDSRWNRLTGSLFETYYCRIKREPHEKVWDYIKRTGDQIMDTMKALTSCPRQGEMFFQYQGDILEVPQIGGSATERIHIQLDSLPFHMQVMFNDKGYYTELRYWENRFDTDLLNNFLICFEDVLKAMLSESSVRKLKHHISTEMYPKHYYIEAGKLNESVGKELIKDLYEDEKVKLYVFDNDNAKQPYGAWGKIYIMDYQVEGCTDAVSYPYGEGTLYGTGLIGRIMPDGTVNLLEQSGRTVLTDGIRGRKYYDLIACEKAALDNELIESAHAYMAYDAELNEMSLNLDVKADKSLNEDSVKEILKGTGNDLLVPKYVHLN